MGGVKVKYPFEMHVHTAECDRYAKLDGAEIVRMYHERGYSGLVITDHYFSLFFDWFAEELSGASHRAVIDRWLRGYHAARNEGERLGFTVLSGAEVRFDGTINDYLVYGLEPEDFYRLPLLNRLRNVEELAAALPPDALIVQAHPFRDHMTVRDPAPLFGIEGYNAGTEPFRNTMAKMFAAHYGKPILSGSDLHHAKALAKGGIAADRRVETAADLVSVLRAGAYRLIENGEIISQ